MIRETKVLSARFGQPQSWTLGSYRGDGGYETWLKVLQSKRPPAELVAEVKASGLRGRGGAGFSTGTKWSFIPKGTTKPIYLCVNGDESEPGTFKDRQILEFDPHLLLEGVGLTCYAIGAHTAYVYLRCEFAEGLRRVQAAIDAAYGAGLFGQNIQGSGFDLEVHLHLGAGAYICGEETSLLNSIEGVRPYPRNKPPFPAVEGLFGCPTIINNVETIANIPHIINRGAAWHAGLGHKEDPGARLWCVSGHVQRCGVWEIETGFRLAELIESKDFCGGMRPGRKLKAVIPGGSSSRVLTADEVAVATMDVPGMRQVNSSLGSAGIIVLDDSTDMVDAVLNLMRFYAHESCGQCTPCREGTPWVVKVLERIMAGKGRVEDLDLLLDLADNMEGRTVCALADGACWPLVSIVQKFRPEFLAKIRVPARAPASPVEAGA
ncbi:MAG TPA: NADH-quinone oxidoreductase subunit NuoF [Candidatus Limnocylindrales bacterium]|nr:NADH-quinone oxidoreductase subunit NuoF [Candidatus Limnocylindrales bacterium]